MQKQTNPRKWYKPKSERPLDEVDKEVLSLGKVHRDAIQRNVGLPTFIYRLLSEEYLKAQKINRALSPKERVLALHLLENRKPNESVLDLLKVVIAQRSQK